jgi:hypothetical protein
LLAEVLLYDFTVLNVRLVHISVSITHANSRAFVVLRRIDVEKFAELKLKQNCQGFRIHNCA